MCGAPFLARSTFHKFCSHECRSRAREIRETGWSQKLAPAMECAICGSSFKPKARNQIYCKFECNLAAKKLSRSTKRSRATGSGDSRACMSCGEVFIAWAGHQKFCSEACKQAARKIRRTENGVQTPREISCVTCGTDFMQAKVFQKYCSVTCRNTDPAVLKKRQDSRYRFFYGVDTAAVVALWEKNGRVCPICAVELEMPVLSPGRDARAHSDTSGGARQAVVDHDHATGKVRDVVCRPCNTAIGLMSDDPTVAREAAKYLTKHNRKRS